MARSSRTKCVSDHTWHVLQPPSSLTPGPCHCLGCSSRVCKAHVVQNGRCATAMKVCMLTIFKRVWANTRSDVIPLPTLTSHDVIINYDIDCLRLRPNSLLTVVKDEKIWCAYLFPCHMPLAHACMHVKPVRCGHPFDVGVKLVVVYGVEPVQHLTPPGGVRREPPRPN